MDYFIRRFDEDFSTMVKTKPESKVIQMKHVPLSEVLQRRINRIREFTDQASKERYLAKNDSEVILANLIMQILCETEKEFGAYEGDFFDTLATTNKETVLDEVLVGFEFYDNNPYREEAERNLEKIKRKRNR